MAQSKTANGSFPPKTTGVETGHLTGDLLVMAVLVGVGMALFDEKANVIHRALEGAGDAVSGHRGRMADKPSEITAKDWKDIAWRLYNRVQDDRVLLAAAGVTFYGLLALFPATVAVVSLYGLFTDQEPSGGRQGRWSR